MGEGPADPWPAAVDGFVLLMASLAHPLLESALIAHHGTGSTPSRAVGQRWKERVSIAAYAVYVGVAALWFAPDRRIEHALTRSPPHAH